MQCALCMPTLYDASKRVAVDKHIALLQKLHSIVGPIKIKGSCEKLMDECILVPIFHNESLYETCHKIMSLIIMK